jgi:hypothetical protein
MTETLPKAPPESYHEPQVAVMIGRDMREAFLGGIPEEVTPDASKTVPEVSTALEPYTGTPAEAIDTNPDGTTSEATPTVPVRDVSKLSRNDMLEDVILLHKLKKHLPRHQRH